MELEEAKIIAGELKARLESDYERIEIAGLLRRRRPLVKDIDLLCIPKFVDGAGMLDRKIASLVARRILRYPAPQIWVWEPVSCHRSLLPWLPPSTQNRW